MGRATWSRAVIGNADTVAGIVKSVRDWKQLIEEKKEARREAVAFDTPAMELRNTDRRVVSDPERTRLRSNTWQ